MKQIINGDDLGLNESCSRAIAEALSEGLITHTTMMATGEFFEEAAETARKQGFYDRVGIHFNLTEGRPLTNDILNLEAFVRDGRFHKDFLRRPRPMTEPEKAAVIRELSAQVDRLRREGFPVTRADSHHYVHTFIELAPLFAQVCREHGIRRVRINRTYNTPERPMITEGRIPNGWWREHGFETTAHFGRLSDAVTFGIPDDTEIMVHPDFDRNGVLIDRTGIRDGFPTGTPLSIIKRTASHPS